MKSTVSTPAQPRYSPCFPCVSLSCVAANTGPETAASPARRPHGGREGESGWPTGRVLRGGSWKPPYSIRVCRVLAAAPACSGAPTGLGMSGTAETLETSRVPSRLHCDLVPWGLNPRLREAPPHVCCAPGTALSPGVSDGRPHLVFLCQSVISMRNFPLEIVRWFACFWSPDWTVQTVVCWQGVKISDPNSSCWETLKLQHIFT